MKINLLLFFILLIYTHSFSQNEETKNWQIDLDSLEYRLLQKDFLFHHFSKKDFKEEVRLLKKDLGLYNTATMYWRIMQILYLFKDSNLQIFKDNYNFFPFEVKRFKNVYYITKIHTDYSSFLGHQLIAINNIPINRLIKKIKFVSASSYKSVANKSLLEFLNVSKTDTLALTLFLNKKTDIQLPFTDSILEDNLAVIIPKKTPFYKEKKDRWFWMYGINFGKQVFFKYNVGLSKEYFSKMKDSLGWNAFDCAKKYGIRLQSVYDAPTFTDFTERLIQKFDNKRYKKLFVDLRGNNTGSVLAMQKFIKNIAKIKRINKQSRFFLLVDNTISSSAIATVLAFKKNTKAIVIGEVVTGTINNTDEIANFYLPNSGFKISFPIKKLDLITITPSIIVEKTILHYINGIDPILQKALDQ